MQVSWKFWSAALSSSSVEDVVSSPLMMESPREVASGGCGQLAADDGVAERSSQRPVLVRILSLRNREGKLRSQSGKSDVSLNLIGLLCFKVGRTPADRFITGKLNFAAGEVSCEGVADSELVLVSLRLYAEKLEPVKVGSLAQA